MVSHVEALLYQQKLFDLSGELRSTTNDQEHDRQTTTSRTDVVDLIARARLAESSSSLRRVSVTDLIQQCYSRIDFDIKTRTQVTTQLCLIENLMKATGFSSMHPYNQSVFIRIEKLLETCVDFQQIMCELGLLAFFLDNPTRMNDFLLLQDDQTILSLYIKKVLSPLIVQIPENLYSIRIKDLLRELALLSFPTHGGYNKGGMHAINILLSKPEIIFFLDEWHLYHIRNVLKQILEKSEDEFDSFFCLTTTTIDQESWRIIASDLNIDSPRPRSVQKLTTYVFQCCFIFLISYIRQKEEDSNCFAIAPLIFLVQTNPIFVLRRVFSILTSKVLQIKDITISLNEIFKYFENVSDHERPRLLQTILSVLEVQEYNSDFFEKDVFIRFVSMFLHDYFESIGYPVADTQLIANELSTQLLNKLIFFPRHKKVAAHGCTISTDTRSIIENCIGILYVGDQGKYLYLDSVRFFANIIISEIENMLKKQLLVRLENTIKLFLTRDSALFVEKFIVIIACYIAQRLKLEDICSLTVATHELLCFKQTGGRRAIVFSFFNIPITEKIKPLKVDQSLLKQVILLSKSLQVTDYSCALIRGFSINQFSPHLWTINTSLWRFFMSIIDIEEFIKTNIHKVQKRMQTVVPEQVKMEIALSFNFKGDLLLKFNSTLTYEDIDAFFKELLKHKDPVLKKCCEEILNKKFYKIKISREDLANLLILFGLQFSIHDVDELYKEIPPLYEHPQNISKYLRIALIKIRGIEISSYELELTICLTCGIPISIFLGDTNFKGDDYTGKNSIIAETSLVENQTNFCAQSKKGFRSVYSSRGLNLQLISYNLNPGK